MPSKGTIYWHHWSSHKMKFPCKAVVPLDAGLWVHYKSQCSGVGFFIILTTASNLEESRECWSKYHQCHSIIEKIKCHSTIREQKKPKVEWKKKGKIPLNSVECFARENNFHTYSTQWCFPSIKQHIHYFPVPHFSYECNS